MSATLARTPPLVAVLDRCNDTSDLLKTFLRALGCRAVGGQPSGAERNPVDWAAFIRTHQPHYIILDIEPPYLANWQSFQRLRSDGVLAGRGVVVTITNKKYLTGLTDSDTGVLEVLEKPYRLDALVKALEHVGLPHPSHAADAAADTPTT